MTDEQRRVHLRLISTLTVRSHTWEPNKTPWGFKRSEDQEAALGAKMKQLEGMGYNRNDIKVKVGCSSETIIKHLGRYKKTWRVKK